MARIKRHRDYLCVWKLVHLSNEVIPFPISSRCRGIITVQNYKWHIGIIVPLTLFNICIAELLPHRVHMKLGNARLGYNNRLRLRLRWCQNHRRFRYTIYSINSAFAVLEVSRIVRNIRHNIRHNIRFGIGWCWGRYPAATSTTASSKQQASQRRLTPLKRGLSFAQLLFFSPACLCLVQCRPFLTTTSPFSH